MCLFIHWCKGLVLWALLFFSVLTVILFLTLLLYSHELKPTCLGWPGALQLCVMEASGHKHWWGNGCSHVVMRALRFQFTLWECNNDVLTCWRQWFCASNNQFQRDEKKVFLAWLKHPSEKVSAYALLLQAARKMSPVLPGSCEMRTFS